MQISPIHFSLFGLDLMEPMALVTNWMIASFCFFAAIRLSGSQDRTIRLFTAFYWSLGISTFFGGLGHVFFQYTGLYGKLPSWSFAILGGVFAGKAVLEVWGNRSGKQFLHWFLVIKSIVLIVLSVWTLKFIFVTLDAILTYLLYCGFLAWKLWKDKIDAMRFFVFGVLVLLPSAFIFLLKLNPHRYLNKDDLSHLLMLACVIFFYRGIDLLKKTGVQETISESAF
jgi:hypothetical protein